MNPDYTQLTPKDLFYTQREAYLRGDMAAVKEMAEIARSRIPTQGDWEEAKKKLDELSFPSNSDPRWTLSKNFNERHTLKKESHELQTYKQRSSLLGYEYEAKMNKCKECNKIMNAVLRMYNNITGVIYERWFLFHGKDVENKSIDEIAEELFAL